MNWLNFLPFFMPVGMSGILLFVSIMAQQGQAFWGSRLMLASSSFSLLSSLALFGLQIWIDFLFRTVGFSLEFREQLKSLENFSIGSLLVFVSSLLGFSVGFLALTNKWVELKRKSLELESLAQKLATERDEGSLTVGQNTKVSLLFPEK